MSTEQQSGAPRQDSEQRTGEADWLAMVRKQVESLKFGSVQITVHDYQVIEVACAEKTRLDRLQPRGAATKQPGGLH